MNRRTLAVVAALVACWGNGESVAHAQSWRLGTYGLPHSRRTAIGPYLDQSLMMNNQQPGMMAVQPDGSYAPGLRGPDAGSDAQQTPLQTGHPVTHNTYQKFFPLGYGTSSGMNINAIGITGIGGVAGYGQGTMGITTGIHQGYGGGSPFVVQRGRIGVIR